MTGLVLSLKLLREGLIYNFLLPADTCKPRSSIPGDMTQIYGASIKFLRVEVTGLQFQLFFSDTPQEPSHESKILFTINKRFFRDYSSFMMHLVA